MVNKLMSFVKEEKGQGMTEYGLVLGLIAVGVVVILAAFRDEIIAMFQQALDTVKNRNNL